MTGKIREGELHRGNIFVYEASGLSEIKYLKRNIINEVM